MPPGPPSVHFVQMLILSGPMFLGLDQQGNCWTGILRPLPPPPDHFFTIEWTARYR